MTRRLAILLAGLVLRTIPAAAECTVPAELTLNSAPLPAIKSKLMAGKPLALVALGAGTTLGAAANGAQFAYPARLADHLRDLLDGRVVSVVNAGRPRQTADDMVARLPDLLAQHPQLVIWDVGTVEAARGLDLDGFAQALETGLAQIHAAGADVILMDMQYAPSTSGVIDFTPYLNTLHRVADVNEVPVYRRYEIMRAWHDQGLFLLDETEPAQRVETARKVYDCLATGLAELIAGAAK